MINLRKVWRLAVLSRKWFRITDPINIYTPYIEIIGERLNGYYQVKIVIVDNIHQFWDGDFYKLVSLSLVLVTVPR